MQFHETTIPGAFIIELTSHRDERGCFARSFCAETFGERGLDARVSQCNVSVTARAGTLRGMHYQAAPHGEAKLIRVVRGEIYDVLVDMRPDSGAFLRWEAFELSAGDGRQLFAPAGLAHGFVTRVDDCELLYQMSTEYVPAAARGVRWDDPAFGIAWPIEEPVMSERDRTWPDFVA